MSATPAPQRIELSPAVRAILEADTPKSQLLRHFLSFTEAIITPDPAGIDRVVSPDVRFHELEAIGYPRGPEGFKVFPRRGGRFASTSIPAADLLMAKWPNAGTKSTSRISSASSLDPLSNRAKFPNSRSPTKSKANRQ